MFRFSKLSASSLNKGVKYGFGSLGIFLGVGSYLSQQNKASASDEVLEPPHFPWDHRLPWQSFDHASIRRGFQVYQQVCASCHSLERIAWRNLVDVAFTEDEVKEMAAEVDVTDGPDDEGEMFDRPGKLSDYLPKPYANDNAARAANAGALPPDLSLVVKARERGADYIFSLLTGYREPPHGVSIREGLHYNPYFPGGAIAMAQALSNDMIEYDDGTDTSISQLAKDVSVFLAWAAEPEHDDRKRIGLKTLFILTLMAIPTLYWKRLKWAALKTRVVQFKK